MFKLGHNKLPKVEIWNAFFRNLLLISLRANTRFHTDKWHYLRNCNRFLMEYPLWVNFTKFFLTETPPETRKLSKGHFHFFGDILDCFHGFLSQFLHIHNCMRNKKIVFDQFMNLYIQHYFLTNFPAFSKAEGYIGKVVSRKKKIFFRWFEADTQRCLLGYFIF